MWACQRFLNAELVKTLTREAECGRSEPATARYFAHGWRTQSRHKIHSSFHLTSFAVTDPVIAFITPIALRTSYKTLFRLYLSTRVHCHCGFREQVSFCTIEFVITLRLFFADSRSRNMARLFNAESIHREHVDPSASYDGKLLQPIQAILIVA